MSFLFLLLIYLPARSIARHLQESSRTPGEDSDTERMLCCCLPAIIQSDGVLPLSCHRPPRCVDVAADAAAVIVVAVCVLIKHTDNNIVRTRVAQLDRGRVKSKSYYFILCYCISEAESWLKPPSTPSPTLSRAASSGLFPLYLFLFLLLS